MDSENKLEIVILSDKSSPGYKMCYVSRPNHRLYPMHDIEALGISRLLAKISGKSKSIIAWFACEESESFLNITGAQEIKHEPIGNAKREPLFCKFFELPEDTSDNLVKIWNSFGGVRIFPADSEDDIKSIVEPDFNDRSDARRFGFDYENRWYVKSKNPAVLILGAIISSLYFLLKLIFLKRYRNELLNPFSYKTHINTVKKCKVYMCKGGADEEVTLEFMTSNNDVENIIRNTFSSLGFSLTVSHKKTY